MAERGGPWGEWGGAAVTALRPVLARLSPADLARAAAVCRTWRHVAADPALWRAALARHAGLERATLRAIATVTAETRSGTAWWRGEAALSAGAWRCAGRLPADGAPLQHADLSACGHLLALAAEDGTVTVWEANGDEWRRLWAATPGEGRWTSCERVAWPPGAAPARLLAVGAVALAARGEAAVLSAARGAVVARAGCAPAAPGAVCWLSAAAFLALELRRAAPAHFFTAVWIYAAEQETWSEDAGVAEPLFRIYNEAQAHISHVVAVETSALDESGPAAGGPAPAARRLLYCRHSGALTHARQCSPEESAMMLVCACAVTGQPRGEQRALAAWRVHATRPPRLRARAQGDLRLRAQRHAARPPPPPHHEELDERAVRALCCPPAATAELGARVLGLAARRGTVWAFTLDDAATCLLLPRLVPLRRLQSRDPSPVAPLSEAHYVWGAACGRLVARPAGAGAGAARGVLVWGARSGCAVRPPPCGAARCCLTAGRWPPELLVLTADALRVWRASVPPESPPT